MIKTKSLKDPVEESDGLRILISRGRPMFLPKSQENWHEWWKQLAPSKSLKDAYIKYKKINWDEYKMRFMIEMNSLEAQRAIKKLAKTSMDITLLCHCQVSEPNLHCHRYLVKDLIEYERLK
jgi:uncharacterized protein YeaO (DUF488 family)